MLAMFCRKFALFWYDSAICRHGNLEPGVQNKACKMLKNEQGHKQANRRCFERSLRITTNLSTFCRFFFWLFTDQIKKSKTKNEFIT